MPTAYCSITLIGPLQADVVRAPSTMHRSAYVLATERGMTVVCDEECDGLDPVVVSQTALGLSMSFRCFAFAVTSDRERHLDIGVFSPDGSRAIWDIQRALDSTANSTSICRETAEAIGNAFDARDKTGLIEEILRVPPDLRKFYCPAEYVLSAIGDVVSIPDSAYIGFTDIDDGNVLSPEGVVRVGRSNEMTDRVALPVAHSEIEGRSLTEWCAQLLNGNAWERFRAVRAIAAHPFDAREAVPALVAALEDHDGRFLIRASAAHAIGQIRERVDVAVPGLLRLLSDHTPNVRAAAAESLGKFGASARCAAPKLGDLLRDTAQFNISEETTIHVRVAAAIALAHITPDATDYRAALSDSIAELECHCTLLPRARELLDSIPSDLPEIPAE